MATRRMILSATLVGAAALPFSAAFGAEGTAAEATDDAPPPKQADFLFVQSARGLAYDKETGKLALKGVSPQTLFFSDRPLRIAGNMTTAAFVPYWSKGKDSFLADPPNADVSILSEGELKQVVVELETPELDGDTLTYRVKVLEGTLPDKAEDVSVFIDVIGMPLTPLSFAGARRRAFRRAYYWR